MKTAYFVVSCFCFGRESCSNLFQVFSNDFDGGLRFWILGLRSSVCTHPLNESKLLEIHSEYKVFFKRRYSWRCCRSCLNLFDCLKGKRRSALSSIRLFSCIVFERSFALLCFALAAHFSAVHSVYWRLGKLLYQY